MRTLKFIINDLILNRDPSCDFTRLIPGTEGYLKAEFDFNSTWDNCVKVVGFYSADGSKEYTPQILRDGKSCIIPYEVLKHSKFRIKVLGKSKTMKLCTQDIIIVQDGGR